MDAEKLVKLKAAANEFATYARLEYEQLVALRDLLAAHDALAKRVEELEARDTAIAHAYAIEGDHCEDDVVRAIVERQHAAIAELTATRDELRAKVDQLMPYAMARCVCISSQVGGASPAQARATRIEQEVAARQQAERERDEARAAVERVREACAELRACNSARTPVSDAVRFAASEIEAVLPREEG